MRRVLPDGVAWTGVALFLVWTMRPVLGSWSGSVLGPFGGIDAMLQLGLLQWTAGHWWQPQVWLDLPIFFPLHGMLGCMDPLLGQAWLIWPLHLLFHPTAAAQYNAAFLGSLVLAAAGMAALWRAAGGTWRGSGVAALALIGAPYTTAQLGHLNQLPPPAVLFVLAAVIMALKRRSDGRGPGPWWWLVGLGLVLQAAWGWYGFAYAVVGTAVLKISWLIGRVRAGDGWKSGVTGTLRAAWLPAAVTVLLVLVLAQPQLRLRHSYPEFTRSEVEVRIGSADIQHLLNRGAYSGRWSDWTGHGATDPGRHQDWARQTLHPGWVALALALYGWRRRGELGCRQRSAGHALLALGAVGLVLAFGDSVGVPGTDFRLPLPLEWMRSLVPPFRAFRGAWRFSWLLTIAVAWWAAAGATALAGESGRRRLLAGPAVALMVLMSLPMGVPAQAVPMTGRPLPVALQATGPVLTLPGVVNEYAEDRTEALWMTRAQELAQPVTGGATGWVPPETVAFRTATFACVGNDSLAVRFLRQAVQRGIAEVEIALTSGDTAAGFWRDVLQRHGAIRISGGDIPGHERYRMPTTDALNR